MSRLRKTVSAVRTYLGRPIDTKAAVAIGNLPLPVFAALHLAEGLVPIGLATRSGRSARAELQEALGLSGDDLDYAVRTRLRTLYRETVIGLRLRHRYDMGAWTIIDRSENPLAAIRDAGGSALVVGSHLAHLAWPLVLRQSKAVGWALAHGGMDHPVARAAMARLGEAGYMEMAADVTAEPVAAVRALVRHLRQPGRFVSLTVDLPATAPDAPRRPFGPQQNFPYFMSAARIARLAKVPIVPRAFCWDGERGIAVQWGRPIAPPDDVGDEERAMNDVLDATERFLGNFFPQYLMRVTVERRWNETKQLWEPRPR